MTAAFDHGGARNKRPRMTPATCTFCSAASAETLEEAIRRLRACVNCSTDIACRGEWTGAGMAAIRALAEKYGRDAVIKAWEATK